MGDPASLFTFDTIRSLPELGSLCRESLRLRNIFLSLPPKRVRKTNFTFSNGVGIKPIENVQINTYYNHREEDIQHDNLGRHGDF
ncbi:hypothetical protein VTP01DRAFT_578 [Rhizomucor pusillus]|uniref:uncharacterized protein n=1 Tax=Rhizomucor pusillus TaxID=4840 RepID=UPI0037426021